MGLRTSRFAWARRTASPPGLPRDKVAAALRATSSDNRERHSRRGSPNSGDNQPQTVLSVSARFPTSTSATTRRAQFFGQKSKRNGRFPTSHLESSRTERSPALAQPDPTPYFPPWNKYWFDFGENPVRHNPTVHGGRRFALHRAARQVLNAAYKEPKIAQRNAETKRLRLRRAHARQRFLHRESDCPPREQSAGHWRASAPGPHWRAVNTNDTEQRSPRKAEFAPQCSNR